MTEPQPDSAEVVAEETVVEPEATTETTTEASSSLLDSDSFVEKVADRVFDKMKVFSTDLISASQAAQQIVAESMPVESAPPEAAPESAPPEDVRPQRRHAMFRQPLKRGE